MKTNIPKIFLYEQLDSTMDEAKRLIKSGEIKDTAVVVADYQTKGRGTHGRQWDSPKGAGIYFSVVQLPGGKKYFETTTVYTLACGIACVESIYEVCGIKPSLKPVNDIYYTGRKLGGILVESKLHEEGISSLVTGVGINVRKTNYNLDREIVCPVSLEEILPGKAFDKFSKKLLIESIVEKIYFWYEKVFAGEHDAIKSTWELYKIPQN